MDPNLGLVAIVIVALATTSDAKMIKAILEIFKHMK